MKVGVDMGSATLRVATSKQGVVLRQACAIGDALPGGKKFCYGTEAERMIGRTPEHVQAVYPMSQGLVSAPRAAGELLKGLLPQAIGWRWRFKPQVVASVPGRISDPHRRALLRAFKFAGAENVQLVAKPVAAALGADAQTGIDHANMVVDIGAETTEVATLSPEIVLCQGIPLGGRHFDRALQKCLSELHELEIDLPTAERLKRELGTAYPLREESSAPVYGREMATGLPRTVNVMGRELRESLAHPLEEMANLIRRTLTKVPPGLAKDILEHGILLTGGGSLLEGLDRYLSEACQLKVRYAVNPADCTVLGLLKTLEERPFLEYGGD